MAASGAGEGSAAGAPRDAEAERERLRAWILADTTRRRLVAFARRFLGEQQEAEDVVQETLVRAGEGLARLRSRERLEAWLFRICRHAAIDRVRARQVRRGLWTPLPVEHGSAAEAPAAAPEAVGEELPPGSLGGMAPHHRLLVRLHYERGLSQGRLCGLTGLSPPALRVRLYRARQALRAVVKPEPGGGR